MVRLNAAEESGADANLNDLLAITAQVSSLLVMNAKAEMHDSSSIGVTLPTDGLDYRDSPTFQDLER